MSTFEEYIEELSRRHPAIRHEVDDKCHFSSLSDDSQTKFARSMHYPCVVLDSGDFTFNGVAGNVLLNSEYSILFLQHVRDTGSNNEVRKAFEEMKRVLLDFVRKFSRDRRKLKYRFLNRFTLPGSEGHRIYYKDAGLYGYILFLNTDEFFVDVDCDHIFND
ncbi:MAG: hypothetical protein IJZ86_01305 [Bacteroides sp.]|nr:hypothetical protein [Bacteroides sp.]